MGARRYGIYLRVFNRYLTLSGKRNSFYLREIYFICLFILFIHLFFNFFTSRLQKITCNTVTSIATLLTFFVFYKYVRYNAIQYLKQYWLKSD